MPTKANNINKHFLIDIFSFKKINNGDIKENITNIFDLKDASLAHTKLQSRSTTGSIIFKP